MPETSTLIGYGGRTIGPEKLALVPTPVATETHRPIPHHEIVQALVDSAGEEDWVPRYNVTPTQS